MKRFIHDVRGLATFEWALVTLFTVTLIMLVSGQADHVFAYLCYIARHYAWMASQ